MLEEIILNFLTEKLPYPVRMEVPKNAHDRFFVLRVVGDGREDFISSATVTVQSYAESMLEAARMNHTAKEVLDGLVELDVITSSYRAGDYPFPDTQTKKYRYQAVQTITHY